MPTAKANTPVPDARQYVHPEKPQSPIVLYVLGAVLVLALAIWVVTYGQQETMMDTDDIEIGPDPTP